MLLGSDAQSAKKDRRSPPREGSSIMHGTLAIAPLTTGPVRQFVDVLGESDETETALRVAVQLTVNLSFAEILGRLLFSPGPILMTEELDSVDAEEYVRVRLWFALTDTDLVTADGFAEMAMDIYAGRRASNLLPFVLRLGPIITHTFGVTSPQPLTVAPAPAYTEAHIGLGGMRS
ncbi:hypothetical protein [Kitasatospora sp. NPDC090308]|uniref:hypothetical protein n=1 Tax=Kitasatospora sp. NPDC090308 TaxID=3364082 RepID=UPI0038261863